MIFLKILPVMCYTSQGINLRLLIYLVSENNFNPCSKTMVNKLTNGF